MSRFYIGSLLNSSSDALIRQAYQDSFGHTCSIRTLHLTFIPPFTTDIGHQSAIIKLLNHLPPLPQTIQLNSPQIFDRRRQILYLPLSPQAPLKLIYQTLLPQLKPLVTFESADFATNQLPDYLPHITLDYDFTHQLETFTLPLSPITLTPPQLLQESAPGIWIPVSSNP